MKLIFFALAALAMIIQGFSLPFFGGKCAIKNKYYEEYLYAADIENDGSRRHVFTWIPDKEVYKESYFLIEPEYGDTFTIKNKKNDEYLYPYYSGKHVVYTWIPRPIKKFDEGSWKIEPIDGENTFTIKSVAYAAFMYAADEKHDESRRYVYASANTDSSSNWVITCDSSEEFDQFKSTFNKKYADEAEAKYRQEVYLKNLQIILAHNVLYEKGIETYSLALNEFADWTHEEFLSTNGYFPLEATSDIREEISSHLIRKRSPSPDSIDWVKKGAVTPVKNQLMCASCWAFSAAAALEAKYYRDNGVLKSLSEQQIVDCSKESGNHGCNKGYTALAFVYTKENGILTEDAYPYEGKNGICRGSPAGAKINTNVKEVKSEADLQDAVGNIGPVSVGLDAHDEKFQFYHEGVYFNKTCEPDEINHAVLAVGYGFDEKTKMAYWLLKNSYGTTWGENGYLKLAKDKDNHCGIASAAYYPV